jgi:hypothetical protein
MQLDTRAMRIALPILSAADRAMNGASGGHGWQSAGAQPER